nr:hypothetical protein [Lacticaseibacillus camelliae]
MLETGDRLLNEAQAKAVQAVFDAYPQFEIKTIHADVAAIEPLRAHFEAKATHLVGGILRSGQEADYTGDVLFLGNLHRGATLRTTGSIFCDGDRRGSADRRCVGRSGGRHCGRHQPRRADPHRRHLGDH